MSRPTRRGAALLLVLAALIVTITASVALARVASTAQLARRMNDATRSADDLLGATEAPILAWLGGVSATVVLPADATEPGLEILHDAWTVDDDAFDVRIAAWDQGGMVPAEVARSGSPLRLAVPDDVLAVVDRAPGRARKPGLDLFAAQLDETDALDVFPSPFASAAARFDEPSGGPLEEPAGEAPAAPAERGRAAIGALVATHDPGGVNVYTAPLALVEEALRAAGRGGIEQIIQARQRGEHVPVGEAPGRENDDDRGAPRILDASTAWAFRVDLDAGPVSRSWWAVYVRSDQQWECVQRLAITR